MARLREITVLVVGSDGPLVTAVVSRLVAEGARIIVARPTIGNGDLEQVSPDPTDVAVHHRALDVADGDAWQSLIDEIRTTFGELHGLVHATERAQPMPLADMATIDVRSTIDVNLLGPALGIRTASALLTDSGGGSIVTIASTEALRGARNAAVFAATNWGLRGLTRSAALELGSVGIRVNTVCPSIGLMGGEAPAALADDGTERSVTMGDVAAMVAFLLSDDSATCTGGDFLVDAGATA